MRIALGARDGAVMFQVDEGAPERREVVAKPAGEGLTNAPRRPAVEDAGTVTETNRHTVHALIDRHDRSSCSEEQHAVHSGGVELR